MQPGSFDPLRRQSDMAGLISEVTKIPTATVTKRLLSEREKIGSSVKREFETAIRSDGAQRYVYNEAMERFYQNTDAFLYELAVWNLNSLKQEMGAWCTHWISKKLGPSRVLSIGDGLGFECERMKNAGHDVTYFEVPGYSAEFAKRLFQRKSLAIEHLTDPDQIPSASFDALVCLDVLEHIPDPPAFVRMLCRYLKPGGVLIVHAPFYMIHPNYPTHVAASRRFSGDTELYRDAGLRILDSRSLWNPLVLQAAGGSPLPSSFKGRLRLLLAKPYLMLGRKSTRPFRMIHRVKYENQKWFAE